MVVLDAASQIKTLCFHPTPNKSNRMQHLQSNNFKSQPTQENGTGNLKRFDREKRTRIEKTSVFPYSVHGLVRIDLGNGIYLTGTGILIGTDLVLTAAHNIFDIRDTKVKYSKIEFIPGINEQEMPFGIFKVIESYVPDEFTRTCEKEDYALLVLDGSPGVHAGYFGLHVAEKKLLQGKELNVIGYPGQVRTKDERNKLKILSGKGKHQLWGMKGETWFFEDGENEEFLINYGDILTTPGQSGSGVFYQTDNTDEYYVIGVHVLGREGEGGYNSATWITRGRFNQITRWISRSRKNLIDRKIALEGQSETVRIKNLDFHWKYIGDFGIEVLSTYEIPSLESLNLCSNKISSTGAQFLSERSNWKNLKTIDLSWNKIGAEGAKTLSGNKSWTNLKTLHLKGNEICAKGAKGLSENKFWTNLRILGLSWNNIDVEGAKALSDNESWTNLTALDLSHNKLGAEGARVLSDNTSWRNLATLDLSSNNIDDEGAKALSDNEAWTNLKILNLHKNNIGDEGAKAFSDNKSWTNLTTLDLSQNRIDDEGARGLSDNKSWKNLATLDLSVNNISDEGAKALSDNKSWTNLTTLYLTENKIFQEGAKALIKRWPSFVLYIIGSHLRYSAF